MDEKIKSKFASFPEKPRTELLELRELIFEIAKSINAGSVEEDLKWGQLSYRTHQGSPIRIDWSERKSAQISVFFHCQTKLIATFRELYPDSFTYYGSRELSFPLGDKCCDKELAHCISIALRYHKLKELPLLGA